MRRFLPILLPLLSAALSAQNATAPPEKPKLIVGIVVDQMRYDYLYRYYAQYGEGGFKRLLREGFSCENAKYNFMPTYTGPGHAAIYTGTTPAVNGIIANDWWDPEWRAPRYVTEDKRYKTVGSSTAKAGQHSPAVLLSSTITDELRLSNNFQSKVVGICLKDRGSILPAGHIPNASYWFDDATGNWISSSYYPDSSGLPQWVQDFNARRLPELYLSRHWTIDSNLQYSASFGNWAKYNDGKYGKFTGSMPYDLKALRADNGLGVIRFTPMGNRLTVDFAMEALQRMELGADAVPDFLCLSFSSTDYCAHEFGIHGVETEDMYLRLDRDLARFFRFLDENFEKNNVLLFLTADHGGAETPAHLNDLRIPAGVFEESKLENALEKNLAAHTGISADFIQKAANQQIWLNWDALADLDLNPDDIADVILEQLREMPGVYDAFTRGELMLLPPEYPFAPEIRRGIHPRRSGDILFQLDPAWHPDDLTFKTGGTTHGSPYAYDTHVPLVWCGWRVPQGRSHSPVSITDIAPTLAAMLRIAQPNGTTGQPIEALLKW
jgi:predicted AlkP superfamily pyrophosphatase or phosphodiesterase